MARLTDKTLAQSTAITPTTLIHIVYTGDPSQNAAGSSYKAELQQLASIFGASTFTGGTVVGETTFTNGLSANTITASTIDLCATNGTLFTDSISGCSPINFLSESLFQSGLSGTSISGLTLNLSQIPIISSGNTLSIDLNGNVVITTGSTRAENFVADTSFESNGPATFQDNAQFYQGLSSTKIRSFSPLAINDGNEGNVHFGSSSGVTVDVLNSRIGIGTTSPSYPLDVRGTGSILYYDPTSVGGRVLLSGSTNIPRIDIVIPPYLTRPIAGMTLGMRAWDDATYTTYGKVGDGYVRAGNEVNGLNLINTPGTNTEDYIRFYAGTTPLSTADIHIQGSGSTRGFVGIGTETPTEKLHVSGNTLVSGNISASTVVVTTSYTPSGSTDTGGVPGSISWDNTYLYVKNNSGWMRFSGETW